MFFIKIMPNFLMTLPQTIFQDFKNSYDEVHLGINYLLNFTCQNIKFHNRFYASAQDAEWTLNKIEINFNEIFAGW